MENRIVLKIYLATYSNGFYIKGLNDYRKEIQEKILNDVRETGVYCCFDGASLLVSDKYEHKILVLLESLSHYYQVILV